MKSRIRDLLIGAALALPLGATIALVVTSDNSFRSEVIEWQDTATGSVCRAQVITRGEGWKVFSLGCRGNG